MNIVYRTLKHHFGIIGTVKSICVSYDSLKIVKDFFWRFFRDGCQFSNVLQIETVFQKKKKFFSSFDEGERCFIYLFLPGLFYWTYSTWLARSKFQT